MFEQTPVSERKSGVPEIEWDDDVTDKDLDHAKDYLELRFTTKLAEGYVSALREAPVVMRRANDILRACRLDPRPMGDPGVLKALMKVAKGKKLSPVLMISFRQGGEIAGGYHRVSLAYDLDPFQKIPVRLAEQPIPDPPVTQ